MLEHLPTPADAEPSGMTGYLAAEGFEDQLADELGNVAKRFGRLLLAPGPPRDAAWAANVWYDPFYLHVNSIGDAAKRLKAIQRNWAMYAVDLHRRSQLIADKLPPLRQKPLAFMAELPVAPLGSWMLLDANTMLVAPRCREPIPHGEYLFDEDRENPPSRAYLKLWETFTRLGMAPRPGERCLDLGACPGGWTWVLHQCGADVIAVDKAPLADSLMGQPRIELRQESAFGLEPESIGAVDWLCSDIICYPDRLLGLVRRWLDAGLVRNAVCTIKFQGETDHEATRAFAAIAGSRVMHLTHNKHELTWVLLDAER